MTPITSTTYNIYEMYNLYNTMPLYTIPSSTLSVRYFRLFSSTPGAPVSKISTQWCVLMDKREQDSCCSAHPHHTLTHTPLVPSGQRVHTPAWCSMDQKNGNGRWKCGLPISLSPALSLALSQTVWLSLCLSLCAVQAFPHRRKMMEMKMCVTSRWCCWWS